MNENMYEESYNKHYVRLDENNNIIEGWSDGPLPDEDTSGAICINERGGYQFRLYPDGEENPPLKDDLGNPLYSYIDGKVTANPPYEPDPAVILGQQKQAKLAELNAACQNTIYAGVDVETSGGVCHFNLTDHDQINLSGYSNAITAALAGLPSTVDLAKGVWYKADGEGEHHRYWSVDDFQKIISEAFAFVAGELTYLDGLKTYVRGLQTAEEVNAVYYGEKL